MNTFHRYVLALGVRRTRRKPGPLIRRALIGGLVAALSLIALPTFSQTADEHASHHPGAAPAPAASSANTPGTPAPAGAGMGDMMGKMMAPANPGVAAPMPPAAGQSAGGMPGMPAATAAGPPVASGSEAMPAATPSGGCMGGGCGSVAAKTPIYSSLMTLPALTPEKRAEIDALASQQINEGKGRLVTGLDALNRATQAGDNLSMQQSVGTMHEGLDELGAGIAARRVLLEGKAPRNLALDWFKREMNLASPIADGESGARHGVTPFHLFTMGLLITFALAMLIMYFYKMRRAASLFGRIKPDPSSPPPGSSPPLAGAPNSSPPAAPPPSTSSSPAAAAPPATASAPGPPLNNTTESPPLPESKAAGNAAASKAPISPASPAAGTPSSTDTLSGGLYPVRNSEATAALPVTANWRGQLRIGSIVTETPSVKTLRLLPASTDNLLPFTFVPGQFLNVAFWIGGARMNRSYSISSSPTKREHVELTVRREPRGAVSRHIDDLMKVGDEIEAGGPVGRFTFSGAEATSIVLIAGGVGITPMMSITRYLTERSWPGDIFFFYACRAPTDFIFANEVAALQRANPKLHVVVTMSGAVGTDWTGPRGRLTKELFTQTVPDITTRRIHLCGPPAMMDSTRAILSELGVPSDQVKTEAFGAVKPTPAPAGTTAKPAAPATGPLVTFSKNNKSAKIHVDQTILELSEELAIGIEFSCRVGTCGVCKVRMTSGEVDMEVQDALDADDKSNNVILACQAKPKVDVAVEA
jgi:ferredoxin-NADP reductase